MFRINVVLPSGHAELLTLLPSSTVQDIQTKTQEAFGKRCLKLVTAKNRVLIEFEQTLEEAEIEDGECLTAVVLRPQLAATSNSAFALLCHQLLPGGMLSMAATVRQLEIGSRVCNRFGPQVVPLTETDFAAILVDDLECWQQLCSS